MRLLGISASLRNARFGTGSEKLIGELSGLGTEQELRDYLKQQTQFRFDDFVEAGRKDKKPFDEIFEQLRKLRGERGLSNSEAALGAALWGAIQEGAEVRHLSLSTHFPVSGKGRRLDELREEICAADAIIVSGPVYFGDRGSLAQSLLEFISADPAAREACRGKIYAGLSVGAKRNGGQETSLIYQLLDMVNLDMLVVGNSSDTTSQYGGTAVAGDVGRLHEDSYGINTCVGTGRRVAHVAQLQKAGSEPGYQLHDPLKVQLWLLQDSSDGRGHARLTDWVRDVAAKTKNVSFEIIDMTNEVVTRCIACDLCPTHLGPKEEYRCIITTAQDVFVKRHQQFIQADAILLCAYSPEDRSDVLSVYQQFIERTRYLRRDNYAFSDRLCAPFVISELSARQNLHLRMLTSAIRHHTVLHHPIVSMVHEGKILASERLINAGVTFVEAARQLTIGRLRSAHPEGLIYRPVGYEISGAKAVHDAESGLTEQTIAQTAAAHDEATKRRLKVG